MKKSMHRTLKGKVARLPALIREEINRMLFEGKMGPEILSWANAQPGTQEILARYFDGVPIGAQNLSEWRKIGYREWLANSGRAAVHVIPPSHFAHLQEQAKDLENLIRTVAGSFRKLVPVLAELGLISGAVKKRLDGRRSRARRAQVSRLEELKQITHAMHEIKPTH